MFNPIKWLLEKNEPNTKETIVTDQFVEVAPVAVEPVVAEAAPASTQAASTSVKDLTAALAFIDDGVKHLGEGAKADLIALAQKYL